MILDARMPDQCAQWKLWRQNQSFALQSVETGCWLGHNFVGNVQVSNPTDPSTCPDVLMSSHRAPSCGLPHFVSLSLIWNTGESKKLREMGTISLRACHT